MTAGIDKTGPVWYDLGMDTNEIINANTNIRITARRLVATLGAWKSDEARLTAAFETALQNGDIENADDVERIAGLVLA